MVATELALAVAILMQETWWRIYGSQKSKWRKGTLTIVRKHLWRPQRYVLDAKEMLFLESTKSPQQLDSRNNLVFLQYIKIRFLPIEEILKPVIELAERCSYSQNKKNV
jgi:hypothetical protein